jgi:hypothetical protein
MKTITFKDGSQAMLAESFVTPTGRVNNQLLPLEAIKACTHHDDAQLVRDHAFYLTDEEIGYNT